jgi:hypothetical protein
MSRPRRTGVCAYVAAVRRAAKETTFNQRRQETTTGVGLQMPQALRLTLGQR